MPQFNKHNENELARYLFLSYIHDSEFEKFSYDKIKRSVVAVTFNRNQLVRYHITFSDVRLILSLNDDKWGFNESILALTIEKNYKKIDSLSIDSPDWNKSNLYLSFQLFSGSEIHIISKELHIEASWVAHDNI